MVRLSLYPSFPVFTTLNSLVNRVTFLRYRFSSQKVLGFPNISKGPYPRAYDTRQDGNAIHHKLYAVLDKQLEWKGQDAE